jgi:hypothetical protein
MLIRLAQHGDEIYLTQFGRECYDEMDFDSFGYKMDEVAAFRNYTLGIDDKMKLIVTCWDKGVLIGLIVFCITDNTQYYDDHQIATEIVYHPLPSLPSSTKMKVMIKIREKAEEILKSRNVKSIYITSDLRYPIVTKMLEKDGYRSFAVQHVKEV